MMAWTPVAPLVVRTGGSAGTTASRSSPYVYGGQPVGHGPGTSGQHGQQARTPVGAHPRAPDGHGPQPLVAYSTPCKATLLLVLTPRVSSC